MKQAVFAVILAGLLIFEKVSFAADVQVYFSPNGGAEAAIINELHQAKRQILLQAYSFTSVPIAKALVDAEDRGVTVTAILDKSNESAKYTAATFLVNHHVPVYIDWQPAIAHSKIMLVDQNAIITGSYNFTHAAEANNTENLLVIKNDSLLMGKYVQNFDNRLKLSRKYNPIR